MFRGQIIPRQNITYVCDPEHVYLSENMVIFRYPYFGAIMELRDFDRTATNMDQGYIRSIFVFIIMLPVGVSESTLKIEQKREARNTEISDAFACRLLWSKQCQQLCILKMGKMH